MSNLLDLLTDLALDPKKQSAFINNPSSLMDEVGLTEAEQTAMMSGENATIAAIFAEERVPFAITLVDPGRDPLPDPDPFPPSPPPDPEPDSD
ncbi:MAG: hypothetical protein EAZ39_11270 [Oscillatoriales cyanobacterium]|uniref:hypothetical protein n=1 Tax=unclassified Microcoleus TaxID=2642155 RepID=UPI001D3096F4|nr:MULTISPECIES: hypothetical protein [unclassified Microcoleus]TAF96147.1 MAG: hypothetical protein EAZ45_24290 [Oscillatoriales cyanobacterium]MCC3436504.1 hypothetical protein [Microcoleus sp. PH2017_05_CCC_O_A]MCC3583685.1 hypothetical protein [Microcoleus sp. PH2017_30_WIL_O_A]MCC3589899.1 hypothetical protein [Microcoleus sp. PH2017_28_MFU_U_A]TAG18598.1 MAG: hypothetical protein EAZ39_11270 [Oscillatoriales cyanobacterium]